MGGFTDILPSVLRIHANSFFYLVVMRNVPQIPHFNRFSQPIIEISQLGFEAHLVRNASPKNRIVPTGQTGPFPDFAAMLSSCYTDTVWGNILKWPWMDEQVMQLSEVYTGLEMVSQTPGLKTKTTVSAEYTDLFQGTTAGGSCLLMKGEPGCGKTTFTHKVAFDWATGNLNQFDTVFVVKLKFAESGETIESMIKNQIPTIGESSASHSLIGEYLRSGRDRVLLVVDGLDEVKLSNFPQIQKILEGKTHTKCHLLLTSRPHVIEKIQKFMTKVTTVIGFSKLKANEFISAILPRAAQREGFFDDLDSKNILEMYRIPLVLQLLALLYKEYEKLPDSLTSLYDQTIVYLIKCNKRYQLLDEEEIKAALRGEAEDNPNDLTEAELQEALAKAEDLSEEERKPIGTFLQAEIQNAMAEVRRLAFLGFQRENQQLVFSRKEVKNDNIFKLGILTAEKGGSGFRPTTVVVFLHKTFQEHAFTGFVASRLKANDKKAWETLRNQISSSLQHDGTREMNQDNQKKPTDHTTLKTALEKIDKVVRDPETFARTYSWAEQIKHAYYGTANDWGLLEKEKSALIEYFSEQLTLAYGHMYQSTFEKLKPSFEFLLPSLLCLHSQWQLVVQAGKYPWFVCPNMPLLQKMSKQYKEHWEVYQKVNSNDIILGFLVGQIPTEFVEEILTEIGHLLVQHSCDPFSGLVLPIEDIQSMVEDLIKERQDDQSLTEDLHHSWTTDKCVQVIPPRARSEDGVSASNVSAVKITGKWTADTDTTVIQPQHLRNCFIAEIENLLVLTEDSLKIATALGQSPSISLLVDDVSPHFLAALLQNLPPTLVRLSMRGYTDFALPKEVNLVYLFLEAGEERMNLETLFKTKFPKLRRFHVTEAHTWTKKEIAVVAQAAKNGNLQNLESLCIRCGSLQASGQHIVELVKSCPYLKTLDLMESAFHENDVRQLTGAIQTGQFGGVNELNFLNCSVGASQQEELHVACSAHNIVVLLTSPEMLDLISRVPQAVLGQLCSAMTQIHEALNAAAVRAAKEEKQDQRGPRVSLGGMLSSTKTPREKDQDSDPYFSTISAQIGSEFLHQAKAIQLLASGTCLIQRCLLSSLGTARTHELQASQIR